MSSNNGAPTKEEFTVGWMCALPIELTASKGMLDEVYPPLDRVQGDENIYTLGRIGKHNIAIACLPAGSMGNTPAAKGATDMLRSFPSIRFGLMVGIGGGAPVGNQPPGEDIRLGDVVVSTPDGVLGGVIKYDRGKMVQGGKFERTGILNTSPTVLRNAVNVLRAKHEVEQSLLSSHVQEMIDRTMALSGVNPNFKDQYGYQGSKYDHLYDGAYEHQESAPAASFYDKKNLVLGMTFVLLLSGAVEFKLTQSFPFTLLPLIAGLLFHKAFKGSHVTMKLHSDDPKQSCLYCAKSHLVNRQPRVTTDPVIHYGTIASADIVMKHAATRDKIRKEHRILCFEMEAAGLMNDFPCLVVRGICDYSDSHKHKIWQRYASATAAAYAKELLGIIPPVEVIKMDAAAKAIGMVLEGIDELHTKLEPLLDEQDAAARNRLLSWISSSTPHLEQSDKFNRRQPGTGQWFLESDEFSIWLNTPGQTLFCPGIPGAGKSVLVSIVIDHLQRTRGQDAAILYLYCTYDQRQAQTTHGLLSTILRQLVEQQPGPVPSVVDLLYKSHEATQSTHTLGDISKVLLELMRDVNHTFLIVDALDECSETTRQGFLREVQKLQASTALSFLATARPSVENLFDDSIRLEIRAASSDIECYLENHLNRLSRHVQQDLKLSYDIKQAILETADGMFLLAFLHLDSLEDKKTKNELREAVQNLPSGAEALSETYNNASLRIASQKPNDREWAQRLLSFIVHARRPLKSDELLHALAIAENSDQIDEDNCPILDEILALCAGLAVHNQQTDTLQLVHYTTYDFLSKLDWIQEGSKTVATACVRYLLSNTFSSGPCAKDDGLERRARSNPFYIYTTTNWGHHIRASALENHSLVMKFLERDQHVAACGQMLLATLIHGERYNHWVPTPSSIFRTKETQTSMRKFDAIHLAAFFGLERVTMGLLATGHNKDSVDSYGQTPLCWAVRGEQEVTLKLLIQDGADPDLFGDPQSHDRSDWWLIGYHETKGPWTPLAWAARYRKPAMAKILLENRANPDARPLDGESPLWWAVKMGSSQVTKLLLENGANPDISPLSLASPLSMAIENGNSELAKLLLENGADPDLPFSNFGTLLWHAALKSRNSELVELLLENGADPDVSPPDILCSMELPLWLAVKNRNIKVAKLLIEKGV